jgi:hypothetical protein
MLNRTTRDEPKPGKLAAFRIKFNKLKKHTANKRASKNNAIPGGESGMMVRSGVKPKESRKTKVNNKLKRIKTLIMEKKNSLKKKKKDDTKPPELKLALKPKKKHQYGSINTNDTLDTFDDDCEIDTFDDGHIEKDDSKSTKMFPWLNENKKEDLKKKCLYSNDEVAFWSEVDKVSPWSNITPKENPNVDEKSVDTEDDVTLFKIEEIVKPFQIEDIDPLFQITDNITQSQTGVDPPFHIKDGIIQLQTGVEPPLQIDGVTLFQVDNVDPPFKIEDNITMFQTDVDPPFYIEDDITQSQTGIEPPLQIDGVTLFQVDNVDPPFKIEDNITQSQTDVDPPFYIEDDITQSQTGIEPPLQIDGVTLFQVDNVDPPFKIEDDITMFQTDDIALSQIEEGIILKIKKVEPFKIDKIETLFQVKDDTDQLQTKAEITLFQIDEVIPSQITEDRRKLYEWYVKGESNRPKVGFI